MSRAVLVQAEVCDIGEKNDNVYIRVNESTRYLLWRYRSVGPGEAFVMTTWVATRSLSPPYCSVGNQWCPVCQVVLYRCVSYLEVMCLDMFCEHYVRVECAGVDVIS